MNAALRSQFAYLELDSDLQSVAVPTAAVLQINTATGQREIQNAIPSPKLIDFTER